MMMIVSSSLSLLSNFIIVIVFWVIVFVVGVIAVVNCLFLYEVFIVFRQFRNRVINIFYGKMHIEGKEVHYCQKLNY